MSFKILFARARGSSLFRGASTCTALFQIMQWNCGRFAFDTSQRTLIIGIVNATPDSFSGDGRLNKNVLSHALRQIDEGADILDIGGESTRPGATPVSTDVEIARVVPLIEKLRAHSQTQNIALSVDTTKSAVARAAIEAGADIINDISGATFDANMLETLSASTCGVVLMHLRGTPQTMQPSQRSENARADVIAEILDFWRQRLNAAHAAGIDLQRIALDAGFGFGKSVNENLAIIARGREFLACARPLVSATSRKSTIGKILNDAPVDERLMGTAATVALAIANGAQIVRVHDVKAMREVARVCDAIGAAS